MTDSVMWIIPEAPAPQTAQAGVRKFAAGALRFGILDNNKSNADRLLAMIVDGVKEKYPDATVVRTRKASAAIGAAADVLDKLEKETDVVIAAMAD
jgi:hypothetical protein